MRDVQCDGGGSREANTISPTCGKMTIISLKASFDVHIYLCVFFLCFRYHDPATCSMSSPLAFLTDAGGWRRTLHRRRNCKPHTGVGGLQQHKILSRFFSQNCSQRWKTTNSPVLLSFLNRVLRCRWIRRLLMEMLPILPTMLTDLPIILTDALLIRLRLLKKLSDIELWVLLTVRFCILISYLRDQTPDTDLIDLEH